MNPPFQPVSFPPGPPTTPNWEDGPGLYVNPSNVGLPVKYAGQNQTSTIAVATPPPGWEFGPGPADPNMSNVRVQATTPGNHGYAPVPQGAQGIGVGNPVAVGPNWPPAHLRFFRGADGNLYALDNTGKAYVMPPTTITPVPGVYARSV
jgi:hypothetical protein